MAQRKTPSGLKPAKQTKAQLAAENARLRRALARRARVAETRLTPADAPPSVGATAALLAAREQQAATAEILRVISASPSDAQPVFDAIARHAVRLCHGISALVTTYDGALLHLVAHENIAADLRGPRQGLFVERFPRPSDRTFPMGVAVLDRHVVHVPDFAADTQFP